MALTVEFAAAITADTTALFCSYPSVLVSRYKDGQLVDITKPYLASSITMAQSIIGILTAKLKSDRVQRALEFCAQEPVEGYLPRHALFTTMTIPSVDVLREIDSKPICHPSRSLEEDKHGRDGSQRIEGGQIHREFSIRQPRSPQD